MKLNGFQWINESKIIIKDGIYRIDAPGKTDRFCALTGGIIYNNAPFYYKEVAGDFVIRAKVSMDYNATYDGAGLLVLADDTHWVKTCFEYTDFNTIAVISIATNGVSDDANGPNIMQDSVWLQIVKKENVFSIHYSLDGKRFDMIRFCTIPFKGYLKVGLVAQAPKGNGGKRYFHDVSLEEKTVNDMRLGY